MQLILNMVFEMGIEISSSCLITAMTTSMAYVTAKKWKIQFDTSNGQIVKSSSYSQKGFCDLFKTFDYIDNYNIASGTVYKWNL